MFQNAWQQAQDSVRKLTSGIGGLAQQAGNYVGQQIQQNAFRPTPQVQAIRNVVNFARPQVQQFVQQAPQMARQITPIQFKPVVNAMTMKSSPFNVNSNLRSIAGQDFNPQWNSLSPRRKVGETLSNVLSATIPMQGGAVPKFGLSARGAIFGYGSGAGIEALTQEKLNLKKALTSPNAILGGALGGVHGGGVINKIDDIQYGKGRRKIATAQSNIKQGPLQKGDIQEVVNIFKRSSQGWKDKGNLNLKQFKKDTTLVDTILSDKYGVPKSELKKAFLGQKIDSLYKIAREDAGIQIAESNIKVPKKEDKFITDLEKLARRGPLEALSPPYKQPPNYGKSDVRQVVGEAQDPMQRQDFKQLFGRWIGERDSATTKGYERGLQFRDIPQAQAKSVISAIENPELRTPTNEKHVGAIRGAFKELLDYGKKSGIQIGELKDYITHFWKENPEQVKLAYDQYRSANKGFQFAKSREIPTYEEGIKIGLTPKYNHPAQIIADYTRRLEQTKANIDFFNRLKAQGIIVPGGVARSNPGFEPIHATGFPKSETMIGGGKTYVGNWYAPAEVARLVNRMFAPETTGKFGQVLDRTGKISSGVQDITLSGGVKSLNAFSAAQAIKEFLAGRIVSPVTSMFKAVNEGISKKTFERDISNIKELQERGVKMGTNLTLENLVPSAEVKRNLGEKIGRFWAKNVNEPTFKRFMPMLQLNLFKDIKAKAIAKGMDNKLAADVAANAVKKFYGLTDTGVAASRSKIGQDAIKTVFFAPRYRESMINFWVNNLKAMKNPLALENRTNTKFIVGAIGTYMGMNYLNQQLNGKNMWENPPGTEDQLLIPLPDGNTLGVPFLSSIATIPRTMAKAAVHTAQGNYKQTGADVRSFLSMAVKPFADLAVNQSYYGQDIYDEQDDTATKNKKMGTYLARSYQHPYIAALIDKYTKGDPGYATVSKALELPFRFHNTDKLDARYYFQAKDEALKDLSPQSRTIYDKLHAGGAIDDDGLPIYNKRNEMANALDRLANPDVLRAEARTAIATSQKTGQVLNPFYLLDPKQQETVLILKTFYPGDKTKSTITNANLEWLKPYWAERDQYVATLKAQGVIKDNGYDNGRPQVNPQLQQKLDHYSSLPMGTGERSQFLRQNPDVMQFFQQTQAFNNQQRADLGLPLLETQYAGAGGGKGKFDPLKYHQKINFKTKAPKGKKGKMTKLKIPKIKVGKTQTPKQAVKSIQQLQREFARITNSRRQGTGNYKFNLQKFA